MRNNVFGMTDNKDSLPLITALYKKGALFLQEETLSKRKWLAVHTHLRQQKNSLSVFDNVSP